MTRANSSPIATAIADGWQTMAEQEQDQELLPAISPSTPPSSTSTRQPSTADGRQAEPRTWTLQLPYQSLPLSLNDRRYRMEVWRAQHNLRNQVRLLARSAQIPRLERIHVQLHYRPTVVRTRDQDNAVATLKPAIDGLRDYPSRHKNGQLVEAAWIGIVPDDSPVHVTWEPPTIHDAEPARTRPQPPRLWLVITEVSDA